MSVETHVVTFRPENSLERGGELDSNFSETSRSNLKQATKSPSHSPSPPLSLHIGLFLRITVLFVGSRLAISSEWKNGIPLLFSVWLQRRFSALLLRKRRADETISEAERRRHDWRRRRAVLVLMNSIS